MNQHYCFTQTEADKIKDRFGKAFFDKVLGVLDKYADNWSLSAFQLIPSYSANLVFICHSVQFGKAVLKIGNGETVTEYNALRHYNGGRYCIVFEADLENGVLLEECIQPGTPLRDEQSLEKRLSVFCSLYKNLHTAPAEAELYPTYTGWAGRITEFMRHLPECKLLYDHMCSANEICRSIAVKYPKQPLLHGDFHHDNILLGSEGKYRIIDPKGVIGDPVFDVPRFILNEFGDEITPELQAKIRTVISILESELQIPSDIIAKCLYVETAMGACWSVESGADAEEYAKLLEQVDFAKSLLTR